MAARDDEQLLRDVADAVEALVKRNTHEDWGRGLRTGADGTPTTWVDDLAEGEALRVVEDSGLDVNVLSEEAGFVDRGGDRVLVMDPIDGTTNAARGIPLYCISLALGRERLTDVELGLVRNLPTGETYFARRGEGATLNGQPLRAPPFRGHDDVVIAGSLGKYANPETLWLALQKYHVRALGAAALEVCLAASGALDVYYHAKKNLKVWDVAAGALILEEAGGVALTPGRERLDAPLSLDTRTGVVAAGDAKALELLEVLE